MHQIVKFIAYWLLKALYRVDLRDLSGGAHPKKMLIVCNHQSLLDGVLLGAFLPHKPVWVVHSQIWAQWHFRAMLRWLPVVVVDTNSPMAVKALMGVIESGRHVAIFPEGRMTTTGSLMKIYDGPAFLAVKTAACVLPVRIEGVLPTFFTRMPAWFPRRLFPKIRITVMPVREIRVPTEGTARQRRRAAGEQMRRLMQETLFRTERMQSLQESFLDAVEFYGRDKEVAQDIRFKPENYGQMLKASLALGRIVSKLAPENARVGVLMPNTTTTAALLFGMFGVRRIPAMINYTSGTEGIQGACELAELRLILTSRAFLEKAKLIETLKGVRGVEIVYLEDLSGRFTLADKLWLMLWALWAPRRAIKKSKPDDPAVVMFTSGSESKPKGVVLSHRSMLSNAYQMKAVIEFTSQDYFLSALPMFHAFGMTVCTVLPLISGCRAFFYPSPLHYRTISELIYDQGCTVVCGTPTFLANYAKAAHPYDFYRLRYAVCGAERLPEETRRLWLDKFGLRIVEGYGATEFGPVISANTPMSYRVGTVGELLPAVEYQLEPVEGIAEGGVLHLRGPSVMLGYLLHDQPGVLRSPSSIFGEGWYNTGDVVTVEDHFVRIVARVKRFAKVAGEMVSLEIVEKIANAASPHHRHAATTQAEGRRGETIILFTEDPALRREQLMASASASGSPDFAIARRIVHIPRIPLLGNGKFDYVKLKSMASELVPR